MTVPLNVQPPKPADVAAAASAAAVRKRRRRAPAGGASDDCFTCSKRNVKCDRRRPYCSQCLELGSECSGYKTQLTWGVGVASRGKLRGLSLPIAKAPPVNSGSANSAASGISKKAAMSSPARARAGSVASTVGSWSDRDRDFLAAAVSSAAAMPPLHAVTTPLAMPRTLLHDDIDLTFDRSSSMPTPPFHSYELSHMSPGHPMSPHSQMPLSMSVPTTLAHQNWTPAPPAPVALSAYSSSLPTTDNIPFHQHPALPLPLPPHHHQAHPAHPAQQQQSHQLPQPIPQPQQQHYPQQQQQQHSHQQQQPQQQQQHPQHPQHQQPQHPQPQQHHHHHHPLPHPLSHHHHHHHKLPHHPTGTPELHLSTSLDSLSDVDYMSPISHVFTPDDVNFMQSPTALVYDNFTAQSSPIPQSPTVGLMIEQHRPAPTSCPGLVYGASEPSSSLPSSHPENFDANISARLLQECDSMGTPPDLDAYSTSAQSTSQFWGPFGDSESSPPLRSGSIPTAVWPAIMDGQHGVPGNSDLFAKMPFFIDYYENTMCPSMVFIDGPSNPFRTHIMQLARTSRSLQHAICALAACNLRMKRKLSRGQHTRDLSEAGAATEDTSAVSGDQSVSEEYQHRNLAVQLLNEQLNDPVKSRHDSVLATILLLCHYRMAESGIARFHTHFAGVKKILSLRRAVPYTQSRDYAWMEALFTYFDAISASINDREAQLDMAFQGLGSDSHLFPTGVENLVGCDRDLFRTIIKLGRLNMLSQNRVTKGPLSMGGSGVGGGSTGVSALSRALSTRSQSPMGSPLGSPLGPVYGSPTSSLPLQQQQQQQQRNFKTEPFSHPYGSSLEEEDMLVPGGGPPLASPTAFEDQRSTFWGEWKEARLALQSWEFDSQRTMNALHGVAAPTTAQLRDLCSLSEAFRYAALLYTERLANPSAPSSGSNFRNFVSQVVYYAKSLEDGSAAEKFLLWPLFVAGSECVNELQQTIVRSKCRDIMARSGYMNNMAALDVLEQLWADNRPDEGGVKDEARAPFNWNRCIGKPGIEVEWIMF